MLPHDQGDGEAAFDWRAGTALAKEGSGVGGEVPCQQSLFLEPVRWMERDILTLQGKVTGENK